MLLSDDEWNDLPEAGNEHGQYGVLRAGDSASGAEQISQSNSAGGEETTQGECICAGQRFYCVPD